MSADNWTTCPKCKAPDQLREDYEFYMTQEGKFSADYSAHCRVCNWNFKFNEKRNAVQP